jgi:hypothetical protein
MEETKLELKETMSLQEIGEKIAKKEGPGFIIKEQLERGYFDPYEYDLLSAWRGISKEDNAKFMNTLRTIPLRDMLAAGTPNAKGYVNPHLKEFLASSGTTGVAGAYYLIPVKLWDTMQTEAVQTDITAAISKQVLGPESIQGTTMKIDIAKDGQYIFNESASGAIAPTETIETVQATLDFSTLYTLNFRIANDLIEDSQFDLIEMHVREAGRQAGEKASTLAATALYTATDGDGTVNSITSGQAYSIWAAGGTVGIEDGINYNITDGYVPDSLLLTHKAFLYSIKNTGAAYNESTVNDNWIKTGYPSQLGGMNIIWSDIDYLNAAAAKAVIFTKEYGLLTGRKRWLRMEKYAEPVKDLTGAVISFRQDSVTLINDSICAYVESS